jgi:hypothetical protein
MPTPTIPAGNLYFNATLWTGDGATSPRTITNGVAGQSFQPDLVWSKDRTSAYNHQLFDSVRGTGSSKNLMSNDTAAEGTNASSFGYLSAFNSNGFSLTKGTDPGNEYLWVGKTNDNYVAWQWKAGGTAVTNTSGTISSQVSANTTSGFSVVTYTGTGVNATVGHGLGVAPSMVIVKVRTGTTTYGWRVYHVSLGATKYLQLNAVDRAETFGDWNNTAPTSSVFSIGATSPQVNNQSGSTYVAYCWAPIAGYSAFGSYTGNGSTDGPFIYLGFRPKWLFTKRTDSTSNWQQVDSSRNPINVTGAPLYPNLANAESGTSDLDLLSNGFKCRSANSDANASGGTYIYMAFAENPFKYANAR